MPKPEVTQMLAAAVEACDERKAQDIRILALDPAESGLTDYFLICSGNSDRQNVAITDAIEMKLKQQFGTLPNSVEGRRQGEWILMDYVDFIVHVFTPEKRAFYGLERLRKSATSLSIADLNSEITDAIAAQRPVKKAVKKAAKKSARKKSAVKKTAAKKKITAKTSSRKTTAKRSPRKRSSR
jgi:ribosome-associated protein